MLEFITKKITTTAAKSVSETVDKKVTDNLPLILTISAIAATILTATAPSAKSPAYSTITIINNYYFAK